MVGVAEEESELDPAVVAAAGASVVVSAIDVGGASDIRLIASLCAAAVV